MLIDRLTSALAARPGTLVSDPRARSRHAAVALILRPTAPDDAEMLFIKRAEHEGDPWSGHIALPGGRHEPKDPTLLETAIRETLEETAVNLHADARLLGTLDEIHPRTPILPPIVVRPHVFVLERDPTISPSHEVAAAFWVPLSALLDPATSGEATLVVRGAELQVSCFRYAEHLIWGMTERILRQFVGLLEAGER